MSKFGIDISPSEKQVPRILHRQKKWTHVGVTEYQQLHGEMNFSNDFAHSLHITLAGQSATLTRQIGKDSCYGTYHEGAVALIPAGHIAVEHWENEGQYLCIELSATFLQQIAQPVLQVKQLQLLPVLQRQDYNLLNIGKMLLSTIDQNIQGEAQYVDRLSELLAIYLLNNYASQHHQQDSGLPITNHQINRITNYIHEHLDQEIYLSDLSHILGLSPSHFSRCFKKTLHISPYQYVIKQRIEKTKILLQDQQLSLTDIALECGFNSQSHMGNCFRQITGMTPRVYRLQCQVD